MATPSVLTFDAEGRAVDFEVWVDDLQLFLQCDRKDGLSLFHLTSGASAAPSADADSTVRSQWATHDAAARLGVRSHLPSTERAHNGQYKSAKTLGDPPPPFCPLLPLLLPSTSLAPSRSALRLPLVGDAEPARARGARALEGLAGAVEVAVEAAGGVGVAVGVVAGVGASVMAVEAEAAAAVAVGAEEEAVAAVAEVAAAAVAVGAEEEAVAAVAEVAAAEVELVGVALCCRAASVVVSASNSSALVRPRPPSSFVSGTLRVSGVGVLVLVPTSGVAIFDLDDDAILAAMYVVSTSDEGDFHLCVPPDPGIEAAALGASASPAPVTGASALSGTTSAQALHTFTLDSGASRSFFRERTTLTPLSRPVAVSLADPSRGLVLAHFSTVLRCPAAPSGTLSGIYLPSFSTNLVSGADLQDGGVNQFTPASQRVTHCTCARTGRHLPTFTRQPGSSVYTLTTESPPVPESGQGRQRAAPHSSKFPPTEAPLRTLHMNVWGPARVRGQGHERYFLLVVDDYSRYTTVFPLRSKGDVTETFMLPASPQQNGIAERRIGMVMDVARTSMIHAAAPHILWPFAVQYAVHQLNLQPRVSLPEASPTLRWTGKVGDASAFRVWGSRAFVRDLSANQLSTRAIPCVFLGFPPYAPGWQFYHPTLHRILSSQDVTFDESVPYYRLFPDRTAPLPPPPLFLAPGPPPGPAPSGVSQVDAVEPVEVAVDSGAARGAEPRGAESGGAEPQGAESRGAEHGGAEPGGAEPGDSEPRAAGSARVASGGAGSRGPSGASSRRELPSPHELCEWFARRWSCAAGAGGATVAADPGVGAGGTGATGPGGAHTGGTGAAGTGGAAGAAEVGAAGGTGAAGTTRGTRAAGPGGAPSGGATGGAGAGGPAELAMLELEVLLALVLPLGVLVLSLLFEEALRGRGCLAERREPASRPVSPDRAARTSSRVPRSRPPTVPGTHQMALRPSIAPLRVPLPSAPESSLPTLADPESDSLRAASPFVMHLLATVVIDPSFESTAAFALVAELVDFAARCRLNYAASLVAESASVCPLSVGGECALSTDVLEDRQEEFQCFAAALPHLVSTLIAPEGDPDALDIPVETKNENEMTMNEVSTNRKP
ncbi:unnamed protein product [Closterium sp. NIES-64]|nr:unnamed protein product [Closterium sp. NIES-64]